MTTIQHLSILESIVKGFTTTNISEFGREKLTAILDEGRAAGISNAAQAGTRMHPDWMQELVIPYQDLQQDSDCFAEFPCPSVIKYKKLNDGFIFVGNEDGSVAYRRVNTRGEMLNMRKHRILRQSFKQVVALYEDGLWKLYSDNPGKIKSLRVEAVFNSPTKLPYFNLAKDKYPIDQTTWDFVQGYLKNSILNQVASTPITTQNTSKNNEFQIPQRRR